MKVEWLAVPRMSATTAHAFVGGAEASVCGRIRNLDVLSPAHEHDYRCRSCEEKLKATGQ